MRNRNTFVSERDCRTAIAEYFGQNHYTLDLSFGARTAVADITYTDFRPRNVVRRELEAILPMLRIDTLTREYTEEAYAKATIALLNDDVTLYVADQEGTLRRVTYTDIITEQLEGDVV